MAKEARNKFIDTVDECLTNGVKNGIFHLSVEDKQLDGRSVTIEGKKVINFGSCSYLGLEVDDRLREAVMDAAKNYGVQYSASRAFSSCNLYEELESLLRKIFDNNHVIFAPTTTLTHIAAIPILVQNNDLVILDHQVHGSVQMAVQLTKARGTRVEMIRHNRMDALEDAIRENPNKYDKIWYMADGVYSMYGDVAPLKDLVLLLEKYHNFYLYVDDAHGMSWAGRNGSGYVMSQLPLHPKIALSTSLSKGFGAAGGALILSDAEMKRKILTCGSSYTFSGPEHPPMLAASIASARIHLSPEIYDLQQRLKKKIEHTRKVIDELKLPSVATTESPIFYLGLGMPRVGYNMVKRLLQEGYYANIGIFPAVPVKCTGLRLPITNGHTQDDITNILKAFEYHFPRVIEEEKTSIEQISRSFNIPLEKTIEKFKTYHPVVSIGKFEVQHETTIQNIEKDIWNSLMGDRGMFDWEGCRFTEETFQNNSDPENNWNMHYLIIREVNGKPILTTFFSELICKDDMISPARASQKIEEIRLNNKYYLSSKVIMMGSLINVGDHLYLDKRSSNWKEALLEMLGIMNEVKQKSGATAIQLRDLDGGDIQIRDFLLNEGFFKVEMPDSFTLENANWGTEEEYLSRLSSKSRWHFKHLILSKNHNFEVCTLSHDDKLKGNVEDWFRLYYNVKKKSLNINTYTLPLKYFVNMVNHPNWEIIELRLKSNDDDNGKLVSTAFCYRSASNNYSFMAVGLDYDFVLSHGCYRQCIYQAVKRANDLKCGSLYLGMDAAVEKKRFGTSVYSKSVYIQTNDNYNLELIGIMQG